ncbi:hypothetical protein DVK02_11800 [Halobellus sp. Atlit-31R]|nr:hypothetical protein DVK02_11800 [Halobellus sp. Atlit-31R]
MTTRAQELIDAYDVDAELTEALLWQSGAESDVPTPEELDDERERVYQFLADDDSPTRAAPDHFYQFETSEAHGINSDALATESDFEVVLDHHLDLTR